MNYAAPNAVNFSPASPQTTCSNVPVSVTASGTGYTGFAWSNGAGNTANVTVNPSSNTTYTVTATGGGCTNTASFVLNVNPAPPVPTVGASSNSICNGQSINLSSNAGSTSPVALISENFNGAATGWTKTNTSTGGTPANAAWTLRPNGYSPGGTWTGSFTSNDASQFYFTNSDAQGSGTTNTALSAPVVNTIGYASLNLDFYHHYNFYTSPDSAVVEVSTNNVNWTIVKVYTGADVGAINSFASESIPLNSYVGQSTLYVRFRYRASWDFGWAIDNVTLTGTPSSFAYAWSSSPVGFTSTDQNPMNVVPSATSSYTVTVTAANSCQSTASTTVNVGAPCVFTWLGGAVGQETNWHNPANWNVNTVPNNCAASVLIPDQVFDPVISTSTNVGNITVNANAKVTINANQNLSVCGTWTGGTSGNATVDGSGVVMMNGTSGSSKTLSGKTSFETLHIKNPSGVSLLASADVSIKTGLWLESGVLNTTATGAKLTMKSTSTTQSSYIDNFTSGFTGSIVGKVVAQRFVGGGNNIQHLIGSPVATNLSAFGAGGASGYVIPLPNCDENASAQNSPNGKVFEWVESNPSSCILQGWYVKPSSASAVGGKGYSAYLNGGTTISATGSPNLAATYTVSNLGNTGYNLPTLQSSPNYTFESGWHLVANPYMSGYTYQPVAGFNALAYVYNPSGPYSGTYQPLNPGDVLPPFQAFMVKVPSGTQTFSFTGANRTRNTSTVFLQQNTAETLEIEVGGNGFLDKTLVAFNSQATDLEDPDFDLTKQRSNLGQPTLFTGMNTKPMAVNTLASIEETATLPLGLIPGANGTFTFTVNGIQSFDPTSYIYLEDKLTNTWQNLRDNSTYTFSMTATENVNRFVLHFTPAAKFTTAEASCSGNGQITIEQPGSATWTYVVNNNNAVVGSGTLSNNAIVSLSVPTGIYMVSLTDAMGYQVVKTIQINGTSAITASATVSSTIAEANEDITFTATTANAATIVWNFGDGTTASGVSAMHSYSQEGAYVVTLTVTNTEGCSSTLTQSVTVTAKTISGIGNTSASSNIRLWSAGNQVLVDFSKSKNVDAQVAIYDILGRELSNENFNKSAIYAKEVINSEAAYIIVKVLNEGNIVTRKLFISNK